MRPGQSISNVAIGVSALLAACATQANDDLGEFARHQSRNSLEVFRTHVDPTSATVLTLELDAQKERHTCGAHAVAMIANYWASRFSSPASSGADLALNNPPATDKGYSLSELKTLLDAQGLSAALIGAGLDDLEREIREGRPVIVPVRLPAAYVQTLSLLAIDMPGLDRLKSYGVRRVAGLSQITRLGLINHFWILAGFDDHRVVVLDPALGYRTLSRKRFENLRKAYGNAAIVVGGPRRNDTTTPLSTDRSTN